MMEYENFKRAVEIQRRIDVLHTMLGSQIFADHPISDESKKRIIEIYADDIRAQVRELEAEFDAL